MKLKSYVEQGQCAQNTSGNPASCGFFGSSRFGLARALALLLFLAAFPVGEYVNYLAGLWMAGTGFVVLGILTPPVFREGEYGGALGMVLLVMGLGVAGYGVLTVCAEGWNVRSYAYETAPVSVQRLQRQSACVKAVALQALQASSGLLRNDDISSLQQRYCSSEAQQARAQALSLAKTRTLQQRALTTP